MKLLIFLCFYFLTDLTTQSPQLTPYPSWEAHTTLSPNEVSEIVSPYHIKADRCGHLWVLDSGVDGEINSKKSKRLAPTRILGYDLRNDNLIQNYEIPAEQFFNQTSILSNIAVEDNDCENIFVYLADSGEPGLIVYSVKEKESWRVKHHFFHPDPLAGNFSITGIKFQTADGLYGLALSEKRPNGFADLYFHPFSSTNEFKVSTEVLRNRTKIANEAYYKDFQLIGSRGSNGQSATSVLDQSTGVIFYAMLNLNRISCWKTSSKKNYTINDGNVFSDPISMVYPSDLKIDDKGRLWVLSNNMQQFLYGELDHKIVNFRILRGPVKEAIKGTACDETAWDIANKAIKKVGDKLLPGTKTDKNHSNAIQPVAFTITFIALLLFVKQQL